MEIVENSIISIKEKPDGIMMTFEKNTAPEIMTKAKEMLVEQLIICIKNDTRFKGGK